MILGILRFIFRVIITLMFIIIAMIGLIFGIIPFSEINDEDTTFSNFLDKVWEHK